jgi:hypothetical protein
MVISIAWAHTRSGSKRPAADFPESAENVTPPLPRPLPPSKQTGTEREKERRNERGKESERPVGIGG